MSFPKNDRKLQSESGKTFPNSGAPRFDSTDFRAAVAEALWRDFGTSTAAFKRVARLIDANDRAVRNWFEASNGPSGEHLVRLMAHSPAVLEAVMGLSGRSALLHAAAVVDARDRIRELLAILDGLGAE
jgi:hypothetical protein